MQTLIDRYADKIKGVISCYDRIILTGTIPYLCYADGMTQYLRSHNIRIFDYPKFAEPYKNLVRSNAEAIAKKNGIEIEFIRKSNERKEDIVKKALLKNGNSNGIVKILSAMEGCPTYKPWHDKQSGKTYLKGDTGKCLHYYFYFVDEQYGYGYIRVPTWCPFRLQIYINGHSIVANELKKKGIGFRMLDNAFEDIDDFAKAQKIADTFNVKKLHLFLRLLADQFCPVYKEFAADYHWSIMQAEYATDIIFRSRQELQPIYEGLIRTAIHTVKPEHISSFLGHKLHGNYDGDIDSLYNVRIQGSKIKHSMGKVSIKMYDKFGSILRIETTINDVSFFKHYRMVEHRDNSGSMQYAAMKKNIFSLNPLQELLHASNQRYILFISAIEDNHVGTINTKKLSQPKEENDRTFKGFNVFDENDLRIIEAILRGEFVISGFRSKNIRQYLSDKSSSQLSRILKRLRLHGLIKKIGKTYKYYVTTFGQLVINACLKIKNLVLIPSLNFQRS